MCTTYFVKLLRQMGITDFEHFDFTAEERLLIDYGRAIATDPAHVPDALFDRMKATFSEEALVVITAMGVMMIANNAFNDIVQVEPEQLN